MNRLINKNNKNKMSKYQVKKYVDSNIYNNEENLISGNIMNKALNLIIEDYQESDIDSEDFINTPERFKQLLESPTWEDKERVILRFNRIDLEDRIIIPQNVKVFGNLFNGVTEFHFNDYVGRKEGGQEEEKKPAWGAIGYEERVGDDYLIYGIDTYIQNNQEPSMGAGANSICHFYNCGTVKNCICMQGTYKYSAGPGDCIGDGASYLFHNCSNVYMQQLFLENMYFGEGDTSGYADGIVYNEGYDNIFFEKYYNVDWYAAMQRGAELMINMCKIGRIGMGNVPSLNTYNNHKIDIIDGIYSLGYDYDYGDVHHIWLNGIASNINVDFDTTLAFVPLDEGAINALYYSGRDYINLNESDSYRVASGDMLYYYVGSDNHSVVDWDLLAKVKTLVVKKMYDCNVTNMYKGFFSTDHPIEIRVDGDLELASPIKSNYVGSFIVYVIGRRVFIDYMS